MICTFIGHRNTPDTIKPTLINVLVDLIENKNVNLFYIGNHGHFDFMAKDLLTELKKIYPIKYYVVLAYIPKKDEYTDYSDTIYIDALNTVPYKYRIIERNHWMIKKSDFVIFYTKNIGNTREFKEFAKKQNKKIINLI